MKHAKSLGLAYSKPCNLTGDAAALATYTAWVDRVPDALAGQHAIRRWEYAMALHAIAGWTIARELPAIVAANEARKLDGLCRRVDVTPLRITDVGGAGSQFWKVLKQLTSYPITVVDPNVQTLDGLPGVTHHPDAVCARYDVREWAAKLPLTSDVVTAISVLEHVPDEEVRAFLRACARLLHPGGLLFLTTDFWDADGPDIAHFHWMRERIYNAERINRLLITARTIGFRSFGTGSWAYPGPQLYDYSVASIALVKK